MEKLNWLLVMTVDDCQINNLSQVNIPVIQYFEFQLKLLGPLQHPKSEVKFFTSVLWRTLLSCFFLSAKDCPVVCMS